LGKCLYSFSLFSLNLFLYAGVNVQTGEEVAVKLEPLRARHPQLHYESKLYMLLQGGSRLCI